MSDAPLVSVCVPSYNYGRFLPDCLESVLQQRFGDLEVVVTDDASTDDTEAVVRRYAAADPRVRYVKNPRRLGMNGNIKHAADLARGRYIKVLCADDWLAPDALERLFALMEAHPSVALATSAVIETDATGKPLYVQFLLGRDGEPVTICSGEAMLDRMARGEGFGGNSSFFIRAEAYQAVGGYDASRPYAADYDLAARLCKVGDYLHTDAPLFYGRQHGASSSSNDPLKLIDVNDWFDIPRDLFSPRRFPDRAWRRFHRLNGLLTARYTVNAATTWGRGRRELAGQLFRIVAAKGNFPLGAAIIPFYVATRLVKRLVRWPDVRRVPPTPGMMGVPERRILSSPVV